MFGDGPGLIGVFDVVRFAAFATFGVGAGFMVLTNIMAFMVLRPPKKLGFLWWHVTSISISFLCLGLVSVEHVSGKLGDPPGWRSAVVLFGTVLFLIAQIIIFRVERKRLIQKRAFDVAERCVS